MSGSPWTDECTFECREWGCEHVALAAASPVTAEANNERTAEDG